MSWGQRLVMVMAGIAGALYLYLAVTSLIDLVTERG